jgi:hypothetical protein
MMNCDGDSQPVYNKGKKLWPLSCGICGCSPFYTALSEIDLLAAPLTDMRFVEFVRKNFFLFPAVGAFAFE